MNKTIVITATVMFAVIIGMSAMSPAMAAAGGTPGTSWTNTHTPCTTTDKVPVAGEIWTNPDHVKHPNECRALP